MRARSSLNEVTLWILFKTLFKGECLKAPAYFNWTYLFSVYVTAGRGVMKSAAILDVESINHWPAGKVQSVDIDCVKKCSQSMSNNIKVQTVHLKQQKSAVVPCWPVEKSRSILHCIYHAQRKNEHFCTFSNFDSVMHDSKNLPVLGKLPK